MAEKEPIVIAAEFLKKLPEAAARLAQKKGLSEEDASRELKKRVKEALEKQTALKQDEKRRVVDQARQWKDKAQGDANNHEEAKYEVEATKYSRDDLKGAQNKLHELITTYQEIGKDVPSFLEATEIQYSPEAARFALRIAQLPKDLQENPYILYKEAAKLYWSMKWTEATPEAVREVRGILDRTFGHIEQNLVVSAADFGSADALTLWNGLDRRFDPYRTKRLADVEPAGNEPTDKKSPEHSQWRQKRITEKQHGALDNILREYQKLLDRPENADLHRQDDLLRKLTDELINGTVRGRHDRETATDILQLNTLETNEYITRIQERRNAIQQTIDAQEQATREAQRVKDQAERTSELEKEGRIVRWDEELARQYPEVQHNTGDIISLHELSREEIELILSRDPQKMKEWFSKFWQSVYGLGKEFGHVDITDQYQWKGFERLITWLYGEKGSFILATYKDQWNNMARFDGIVKGFFQSGDIKEKYKRLAFLTPQDMQYLFQNFELAEYTHSLYTEVMLDILNSRIAEFEAAREWFRGAMSPDEITLLQGALPDLYAELFRNGAPITRDRLLQALQKQHRSGGGTYGGLPSAELDILYKTLQEKRDLVGRGVYLRDQDMIANSTWYQELSEAQQQYDYIQTKLRDPNLTTAERARLNGELPFWEEKIHRGWKEISLNPHDTRGPESREELSAVAGYSPVEIEVRERLIRYLRVKKGDPNYMPPEWMIRNAVWASRNSVIGWGEALDIAAKVARAPVIDLNSEVTQVGGRDVMPAGFAEPILRVLNPDLFADRFSVGGKMGDEVRDIYYPLIFERFNMEMFKEKNMPRVWRNKLREAAREGKPKWRVYLAYAEEELKIPYSEIIRTGFLHTGLHTTASTWRPEIGLLEAIRKELLEKKVANRLPTDAVIDNEALSIQFMTTTAKEGDLKLRKQLLSKMLMRTPSRFFQLMSADLHRIIEAHGIKITSPEWRIFQRALSNAQMVLWDDQEGLNVRPFDFSNRADFDAVLRPQLEAFGVRDPARVDTYYQILTELKDFVTTVEPSRGKSILDRWAEHEFPITFPLSDFNWKKARVDVLPVYSNERRINDNIAMAEARDKRNEILYKAANISPAKPEDTLKLIKEFRDIVNFYDSTDVAEANAEPVLETFLAFNYNRAIDIRKPIGLIPGAVTLLRNIGELDPENIPLVGGILMQKERYKNWVENGRLRGRKVKDFPRSLAQLVSWSVGRMGPEANAWDEFKTDAILDETLRMGIFTDNPHIAGKLRRKFKSTFFWKAFWGLPRKYWWVVPLATIAVSATQSLEEEKKKG